MSRGKKVIPLERNDSYSSYTDGKELITSFFDFMIDDEEELPDFSRYFSENFKYHISKDILKDDLEKIKYFPKNDMEKIQDLIDNVEINKLFDLFNNLKSNLQTNPDIIRTFVYNLNQSDRHGISSEEINVSKFFELLEKKHSKIQRNPEIIAAFIDNLGESIDYIEKLNKGSIKYSLERVFEDLERDKENCPVMDTYFEEDAKGKASKILESMNFEFKIDSVFMRDLMEEFPVLESECWKVYDNAVHEAKNKGIELTTPEIARAVLPKEEVDKVQEKEENEFAKDW